MDVHRSPHRVTLHRFFLPPAAFTGDRVRFPPDAARQIGRVLRLRPGDEVIVLDGSGDEMTVRLEDTGRDAWGTVLGRRHNEAEPSVALTLYVGLLKAAKLEMVLQKGTEIGVGRFVPVITERAVPAEPGAARLQRFDAIAREAAEQSRRGRIPTVAAAMPFAEAVREAGGGFILWEDEGRLRLEDAPLGGPTALFVGPEGGFTEGEVALAREAGILPVTLGPRILRAETAAVVGSALLLARLGELG